MILLTRYALRRARRLYEAARGLRSGLRRLLARVLLLQLPLPLLELPELGLAERLELALVLLALRTVFRQFLQRKPSRQ